MVSPSSLITVAASTSVLLLQPLSFSVSQSQNAVHSSSFGFTAPALAAESVLYKPPIRQRPVGRTSGTGSRGCDSKTPSVPITPLVPKGHVGQTISGRPTFFWYSADTKPVRFALVEPGIPKPILEKTVQVTKPGIMQLELPKEVAELNTGKEYRWSVSIICNPNRPSNDTFTQAFIERVALDPELTKQLAATQSPQDRARILAQTGLWYDALATLAQASAVKPSAQNDLLLLLDQAGLTEITARERKDDQAAKP
ncbi:DUF928 domain-containing protein [Kovacikia minuta CCNUW1]|uniref:DUF928 domain-containing protein n=1 Tax=Kovacikia minuta TaxID=2931930 RepID=UPI001CC91CE1|nr:DUF928 domain-containing protein [Kovacikia minuta]UBF28639.1 DUF928 domain-containing protein [Kovacikia minuta CCNUW1]